MAETSYPIAGGAGVNEYTYELLMAQAMGSGRIEMYANEASTAPPAVYADATGRQYKVQANVAHLIRGYRWESGGDGLTVPLDANTSGQPRMDRAVLRLDRADYTVRLATLKGTPSTAPSPPAVTQTIAGSAGVYEIPLARITVRSQSGTNLPAIASTEVANEHKWLMPAGQYGYAAYRGTNGIGKFYLEHDTGRLYMGALGGDILVGENGPMTKISPAGGWTNDNIYAQRINGITYLKALLILNTTDRAPGTDMTVTTLPPAFRPTQDVACSAWMTPGQTGYVYIDAQLGTIVVTRYPSVFPKAGVIVIGPVSYPSTGVRG